MNLILGKAGLNDWTPCVITLNGVKFKIFSELTYFNDYRGNAEPQFKVIG